VSEVWKTFVAVTDFWGEIEIEYSRSFEVFGFTFAIHCPYSGEKIKGCYVVSEVSTGFKVLPTLFGTMKEAEKEGRKFLEEKGEAAVKKAVKKGTRSNTLTRKRLEDRGSSNAV
jgi:hypothetical protein